MNKICTIKLFYFVCILLAGCGCSGGRGTTVTTPPQGQNVSDAAVNANLPTIPVEITTLMKKQFTVTAEVAVSQHEREVGLMNRKTLAADAGMLFVFEANQALSFWMKNTYIPLDMIFISADKEIVDINPNATPLSTDSYSAAMPAKYVLEVNGGWCDKNGVQVGDKVVFAGY